MDSKHEFLASLFPNIASQLRGTLGTFYMASSQLISAEARKEDPALDAKAALIDQSYYQLLRMISTLSSAEYLVQDQLPLRDGDIVALVRGICEESSALAQLADVKLQFLCTMEHCVCSMHAPALSQLLYHLLSNALKFTPAGGSITVELRQNNDDLLLSVTDTGCGIPQELVETLFSRYLDGDAPQPLPHGLGLGLPLCRWIAEGHGGRILVTSKEGEGSRFTVSLPNKQAGDHVSDTFFQYTGGFNPALMGLADALPSRAFSIHNQR